MRRRGRGSDNLIYRRTAVNFGKTLLAIAGATILLGALVGSASARNFSVSNQNLRATFRGVEFGGGFGTTRCDITIEGSFHSRTTPKVLRALTGYITRAAFQKPCAVGDASILTATLPWHVTYAGFSGTLPNITAVSANAVGAAFGAMEPAFGFVCLSRSTAESPATITFNREAGGALTTATAGGTISTSCGLNGTLRGTSSTLTLLGATSRITVTLI
jgi:hypothetical protein